MSASFRDEFCVALAETYFTCKKYVTEDGLSLENKKIAVECSMNLMVDMLARLPPPERYRAVSAIISTLPGCVITPSADKEISS